MVSSHGQSFGVLQGKIFDRKKEKESDISALYLQIILIYLAPNFMCNSVPQILHIKHCSVCILKWQNYSYPDINKLMYPKGSLIQFAKKITLPKSMGKHERRASKWLSNMGDA